jgi:hypothetical protein
MEIKPPTKTNWTPDQLTIRHLETCLKLKNREIEELRTKVKKLKEKIK